MPAVRLPRHALGDSRLRSADLPTRQLGSEGGDLSDGRSDVRIATLRHLLLEIAAVLLMVDQPDLLSLTSLELEEPKTVVEVGR